MKQLQLKGKTLGVVDVPEGHIQKRSFWINNVNCIRYTEFTQPNGKYPISRTIKLPPGQWVILGRLNDITEEQAAGVTETISRIIFNRRDSVLVSGYKDYEHILGSSFFKCFEKATESLQSFFRSHGIEGNPLIILKEKV